MALKLNERYPGRFNNPTPGYPQGSYKNRTTPDSRDGSYLEQDWANDQLSFLSSILEGAGVEADGSVDAVGSSQYYDALIDVISENASTPQATEVVLGGGKVATQTQVTAGVSDATILTPLKLSQRLAAVLVSATTSVAGLAKIATQALVNAGSDAVTFVTPATLRFGVSYSLTLQGYLILPSWLAGVTVQWGSVGSAGTVNFPTAFTQSFIAMASANVNGNFASTKNLTTTSVLLENSGNQPMTWWAVGRV
ncbi:hypothetical protein [Pseudomonas sp. S5D5]|uniref:hypothetical protein n=1 Tax=Pseudomonas sp. S5D5 TaxID=2083056 RepID=UPI001300932D|nr:hypothetical protein [Pseudomonas sp. S5D5]